ncbi:DUF86 domain-containing protein [Candidatus Micrarchaeota archaeon]|nr:DUF86 domain-containing protein [Candidatus Micrarchaeota archaeon]MBU1930160.1 DUF86 domain-containing protein [Candidatus Micrarchaeota archaeon]
MNARLKEKIREIESFVTELESFLPTGFFEYKEDVKTRAACELFFEKIVEGIVDAVFLVIREKSLKAPEEDKEAFDVLVSARIIPSELAFRLKQAKGMRNILAHEYGCIDDELVFESLTGEIVRDANSFLDYLKKLK